VDILKFAEMYKLASSNWWEDNVQSAGGVSLPDSFWIKFVQMCQRLQVKPANLAPVLWKESGFKPSAMNFANGKDKPPVAQGLNQLIHETATKMLGMPEQVWQNFYKLSAEEQLPWVEKYFQKAGVAGKSAGQLYRANFGGYNNPDGSLYASLDAQKRFIAKNPGAVFQKADYQQKVIDSNAGLVDGSGRITMQALEKFVAGGTPMGISAKIKQATEATAGTEPPPYIEPSTELSGTSTTEDSSSPFWDQFLDLLKYLGIKH